MKDVSFRNILLPTDFSNASADAVSYALSIAVKYTSDLHVLHVMNDTTEPIGFYIPHLSFDHLEDEMLREANNMLKGFCKRTMEGIKGYTMQVIVGTPYLKIVDYAKEHSIDLIVMGSVSKASSLDRLFFGSTTERVLRAAPCHILTIHPRENTSKEKST